MTDHLNKLIVAQNKDVPLAFIDRFSVLRSMLDWWHEAGAGEGAPRSVDPVDLPRKALPHLILVDLVGDSDAVIRLAGTLPCNLYGHELKGTSVHDFFDRDGAAAVLSDLHTVAKSCTPMLTHRRYVSINGKLWNYTRLLLPLRPDGQKVTRILKALEPGSFGEIS